MIRAAILPYARVPGGACCIVVVHDGPAVLAREEIPVGHLATVDGRITRVVGPPEVAAIVARVVEIVRERGVEEVRIEDVGMVAGVEADRARAIAEALGERAMLITRLRFVPAAHGDIAARLRALMEDEGPGVGGETSSPARAREPAGFTGPDHLAPTPAQSITSVSTGSVRESEADPTPAPPPAQAPKVGRRVLAVDPGSRHVAAVVLERLHEGAKGPVESPSKAAIARRVDEVADRADDAAEHRTGVVAHTPHPTTFARHVASLSLTIGRDVPLRRPKLVTPKNGREPYYKTTRHEVTDEDIDELLRTLATFAAEHDVDEAAVEVATFAHKGAGAFLLRSNEIGGEVRGWLRSAGLPVRRVSSRVWRARVRAMYDGGERSTGHEHQDREEDSALQARGPEEATAWTTPVVEIPVDHGAPRVQEELAAVSERGVDLPEVARRGDATQPQAPALTWRPAVRALVADLPPDADAHILDASGAALWALAPEPAPEVAPPAKPRAPRAQGGGKGGAWTPVKAEWLRRKREAAKLARGCIGCVGQHQEPCPIAAARAEKLAPSMRGNQNAARGAKV